MVTEEDFEKLFDGSILESLEGALNDISLQMQSSSSDLRKTEEGDVLSLNSDYSSIHDDDAYTNDTNDTGFSSDEEEDPETGEQELFAMMDNLVAELETEMEFFVDKRNDWDELPTVLTHEENNEKHPISNADSHAQTFSDEVAGVDCTKSEEVSQDQNMNQRAKSLLKVLSGLAQPDDAKVKVPHTSGLGSDTMQLHEDSETGSQNSFAKGDFIDSRNNQTNIQNNLGETSDLPSENTMKHVTGDSRQAYTPTEADFKHFVGVLADYSKRRRRAQVQDRRRNLVAIHGERSRDPSFENLTSQTDTPKTTSNNSQELLKPQFKKDETVTAQDQREKTSRAIASFTLKKRREYMQRKSRSRNTGAVASIGSTSAGFTTGKSISGDSNGGRKEVIHDNTSGNVWHASPSKKKKKKKKGRRTNKHRKGRPKRLTGGRPADDSPGARKFHASNSGHDNRTREEVVRALAKTELWRWLVTQVQDDK